MRRDRQRLGWIAGLVIAFLGAAAAAPPKPAVVVVLGEAPWALADAAAGARIAASAAPPQAFPAGVQIQAVQVAPGQAGRKAALRQVRAASPLGVVCLTPRDAASWWKAARSIKVPWISIRGVPPDGTTNPGHWLHVGYSPEAVAVELADRLVAPLFARRVGIVTDGSDRGLRIAAGVARNLSPSAKLAGVRTWPTTPKPQALAPLKALEADWLVVALQGENAQAFVRAVAASDWRPKLLFADGARDEVLLTLAEGALEACAFLDAPDPELQGRLGESLLDGWDRQDRAFAAVVPRAFEAARLIIRAVARSKKGSRKLGRVWQAFNPTEPAVGTFGKLAFGPHGRLLRLPFSMWRVHKGTYEEWPADLFPTVGCGPPIGFGRPPRPPVGDRGKIGYLHFGEGDKRTIAADLEPVDCIPKARPPRSMQSSRTSCWRVRCGWLISSTGGSPTGHLCRAGPGAWRSHGRCRKTASPGGAFGPPSSQGTIPPPGVARSGPGSRSTPRFSSARCTRSMRWIRRCRLPTCRCWTGRTDGVTTRPRTVAWTTSGVSWMGSPVPWDSRWPTNMVTVAAAATTRSIPRRS